VQSDTDSEPLSNTRLQGSQTAQISLNN